VAFEGSEARAVYVQVLVAPGLPAFNIDCRPAGQGGVGSQRTGPRCADRLRPGALPARRITINLTPADLPIAIGLIGAIDANLRGEGLICPATCGSPAY
jgi:predicted ATPase with chaperone activity